MRKIICHIVLLLSINFYAADRELPKLLKQLDNTVANKGFFFHQKQARIDSMKAQYVLTVADEDKIGIAQKLCFDYSSFLKDSALVYASEMNRLAMNVGDADRMIEAMIDHVRVLCTMGYFKEAWDILEQIDRRELNGHLVREYCLAKITYYNHLVDFSPNNAEKEMNRVLAQQYRDSIVSYDDLAPNIRIFQQSATFLYHKQYEAAIVDLDSVMRGYAPYSRDAGIVAYSIAEAYENLNQRDKALRYYVMSSISDLRNGVREYRSLRRVAKMLFQQGDIDRANSYMRCSLEDAIDSNAHLNTIDASDMFLMIDKTFKEHERKSSRQISVLLLVLVALCIVLVIILLKLRKQKGIAEQANFALKVHLEQMENVNGQLSESSQIKEQYIGLYMEQYSTYLNKFSALQKRAVSIAKRGDNGAVMEFLQSSFNQDREMAEFHNNFDVAVVSLFPNFVMEFNELLLPEHSIAVDKGKILTPELRIFALIRLGITDSVKISYFLQYSISTIYNYRTKMRNKACGNRDEFEEKVMGIGRGK